MIRKIGLITVLVLAGITLSGCTTCDVALWLGDDVCAIGSI
ncbi:hypothetical protein [Ketobacter alkanivorans]|nr:hypothetical protein [Ketobacter alkanivorans]